MSGHKTDEFPWLRAPLDEWSIVGMNHYYIGGEKKLYIAMVKGDRCIKEEGPDGKDVWDRLLKKASDLKGSDAVKKLILSHRKEHSDDCD